MKRIILHMFILLFLSLCFPLIAKEKVLFVYTSYEPANYRNREDKDKGFFIEILKEALENRMGLEMKTEIYPWPRCQIMVKEGSADLIATVPTAERLSYCTATNKPFWNKQYRIYTWLDHPGISNMNSVRSVLDLKNTGLQVISYIGNDWSKSVLEVAGIPVIYTTSVESMYLMLIAKRADLLVEDPLLVHDMLVKKHLVGRLHRTEGIVENSPFHFLVSKKSPLQARMPEFNIVIDEMIRDGSIDKILASYR